MASDKNEESYFVRLGEKLLSGAIAGIVGGSLTFPLDTVKTRLQNDKTKAYRGFFNCFATIARKEGIRAFYKGLPAVIVGITPEKAIKLGVNDFCCELFQSYLGTNILPVPYLVLAGGIAGTCQFIATNPMEVVKINMQVSSSSKKSAFQVAKELGFRGLYKSSSSTLLRDIPFSMMYFATYGYLKQKISDETGYAPPLQVLGVSTVAGIFSSALATPADVIKTRLQVTPPPGVEPYKGIADCFMRTVKNEGFSSLFKGVVPRVLVVSPLFGIALAVYEIQKTIIKKFKSKYE